MTRAPLHCALCAVHCALLFLLPACATSQRRDREPLTRPIPRTEVHHAPEPLVTPVPGEATVRSRIRVAVRPLGAIEYDGQVLPLVSPDGANIASSTGAAPSWPALLGEPGASPPAGARIVIYDVAPSDPQHSAPSTQLHPVSRAHELPHAALMLGRSTNERGFLVESPRPDGSRWIGFADWKTGSLDWLIRDERINAHAVLAPNGAMAFARRKDANSPAELVFLPTVPRLTTPAPAPNAEPQEEARSSAGAHELTWRPPTATSEILAPAFSADGALYAFLVYHEDTAEADRGVELVCFTFDHAGLAIESRIHLSNPANPLLWVHQALAPMNGWLGVATRDSNAPPAPTERQHSALTFFHPDRQNLVTWLTNPAAGGGAASFTTLIDWAEGSVAWAPIRDEAGTAAAFLATPDGLVYQADPSQTRTDASEAVARALATPGIPRATRTPERFLLLSPASDRRVRSLDLIEFGIPTDTASEQTAPSGTP